MGSVNNELAPREMLEMPALINPPLLTLLVSLWLFAKSSSRSLDLFFGILTFSVKISNPRSSPRISKTKAEYKYILTLLNLGNVEWVLSTCI